MTKSSAMKKIAKTAEPETQQPLSDALFMLIQEKNNGHQQTSADSLTRYCCRCHIFDCNLP